MTHAYVQPCGCQRQMCEECQDLIVNRMQREHFEMKRRIDELEQELQVLGRDKTHALQLAEDYKRDAKLAESHASELLQSNARKRQRINELNKLLSVPHVPPDFDGRVITSTELAGLQASADQARSQRDELAEALKLYARDEWEGEEHEIGLVARRVLRKLGIKWEREPPPLPEVKLTIGVPRTAQTLTVDAKGHFAVADYLQVLAVEHKPVEPAASYISEAALSPAPDWALSKLRPTTALPPEQVFL